MVLLMNSYMVQHPHAFHQQRGKAGENGVMGAKNGGCVHQITKPETRCPRPEMLLLPQLLKST